MFQTRHLVVTILIALLTLHACKKDGDDPDNETGTEDPALRPATDEEPAEGVGNASAEDEQVDENAVTTVEEAVPAEPAEPAGPVIEPFLIDGHPYERTVEFRSKRETRVERGNQSILGTIYLDWSITYQIKARERTSKRDYIVDIKVLDVSATRDSEPWADNKLPAIDSTFRCSIRQQAISCNGMPRAVEEFAQHWLFATWADFVPASVVSPGERWQRRGPYGARFGIDGGEPTTLAFEVTAIERLSRNQFRIQHDLQIEGHDSWATPGGQRRADINGSGDAEFDSILGLFSSVEVGWDAMLVHEGRVGSTPFRFTRREDARLRIDTSSPSGRPGAVVPSRRPDPVAPIEPSEDSAVNGNPGPTSNEMDPSGDDSVGERPY